MDDRTFDVLARRMTQTASRRRLGQGIATALGAALLALPAPSQAKKKRKGCQFQKRGQRWTLRRSCTTRRSIVLPPGVTLDGKRGTITLAGQLSDFLTGTTVLDNSLAAGIIVSPGTGAVRNLTVRTSGGGLQGDDETSMLAGILLTDAGGDVTNATLNKLTVGERLGIGIVAVGTAPSPLRMTGVKANGLLIAVAVAGQSSVPAEIGGEIRQLTVTNCAVGVMATTTRAFTVTGSRIAANTNGISIADSPAIAITNSQITLVEAGPISLIPTAAISVQNASIFITGNTITSEFIAEEPITGVAFVNDPSSGTVRDNVITGFLSITGTSCGIDKRGQVTSPNVDGNDFPDPPGNGLDICS